MNNNGVISQGGCADEYLKQLNQTWHRLSATMVTFAILSYNKVTDMQAHLEGLSIERTVQYGE